MFENSDNWKNLEGTYVNPIVIEDRMTTIDEVKQHTKDKNPEIDQVFLEAILARLEIVQVNYLSKDNKVYAGQLVVDKDLVPNILMLFKRIEEINIGATKKSEKFFIEKIIPISNKQYDGDDEKSMADNNTSGFNFRTIKDSGRLSTHAFAFGFDVNPRDNPLVIKEVVSQPKNGKYDTKNQNTLTAHHIIVQFLKQCGFEWDGDYSTFQDYQHFQKTIPTKEYIDYYLDVEIKRPDLSGERVAKRIERLIYSRPPGKYVENIERLLADEKVKAKIGPDEHKKFSEFFYLYDKF